DMPFHLTRREAMLSSAVVALVAAPAAHARSGTGYRDPSLPVAARVKDLLARMTIEEKTAQMLCMWERKMEFLDDKLQFSPAKAQKVLANGIGQLARPTDIRGVPEWDNHPFRSYEDGARLVNAVQRFLVENTRLGIPALLHDELAHGLLAGEATIFPIPTALGSTWDPDLVEQVFTVAAREARARGTTVALTPVIDLLRDPRWGRCEEFFGEDPHHVAQMGIAAVRGMQGRTRPLGKDRVFVTLKHFVHGMPQGGLNIGPADMSERTLRSEYLVPFAEVIKQTNPAIIMPSYNEIMGVPSHANGELLQATGRQRLGFKGVYFSDYEGVGNLKNQHHVAATSDDAAVMAITAGVAADLPEGTSYARIPELVRAGRISEAQIDDAVSRILALKFEAGLFEEPYVDLRRVRRETGTPLHVELARTAAQKSLVLLKNDGALPIEPKGPLKLAVIGPNAVEPLFGGYSGGTNKAVGILEGVRRAAPTGVTIEHADGVWIAPPDSIGVHRSYSPLPPVPEADNRRRIAEAVELAKRSDTILLVVGDVPSVTREAVHISLPGDRNTLGLWGMQDELVEALIATGKPIIALLINGRPLAVNRLAAKANALIEGWYPGQEGGHAFADVLFGKVNPGGKLPVSFPRSAGALPVWYNHHPSVEVNTYLEGGQSPLFPFGHGLSYTTFDISAPRLGKATIAKGESVSVEIDVRNTGKRSGDEVVQLYIRDDVSSVPRPVLELRHFRRVTLAAGEMQTVRFDLTGDDLAFWDIAMNWTVERGTFTISAGPSSAILKSAILTVA
ncbi:MAG: glycoside hydrolase family 3 N-terminal domain-containing protein, partial [Novosphingobium sp.]